MSDWGQSSYRVCFFAFRNANKIETTEESDSEPSANGKTSKPAAAAPAQPAVKKPVVVPGKKKWEGEDEEDSDPVVFFSDRLCSPSQIQILH